MAGWRRQFEADLDAMGRAIEGEHQAAIAAGLPWPPRQAAQAETMHAEAAVVIARLQRDGYFRDPAQPGGPCPGTRSSGQEALAPQHEPDDRRLARLDVLQVRADEAAHRIAAGTAAREDRAQYTARLERQAHAQAEPAAERQAEASDGIEMEL